MCQSHGGSASLHPRKLSSGPPCAHPGCGLHGVESSDFSPLLTFISTAFSETVVMWSSRTPWGGSIFSISPISQTRGPGEAEGHAQGHSADPGSGTWLDANSILFPNPSAYIVLEGSLGGASALQTPGNTRKRDLGCSPPLNGVWVVEGRPWSVLQHRAPKHSDLPVLLAPGIGTLPSQETPSDSSW